TPRSPNLRSNYVLPTYGDSSKYHGRDGKCGARADQTSREDDQGKASGAEARVHGFGELEAVLMQRIWDHGGTLTVRDLFEELREERNIAYTTVMSTMDNLYRKGWLARERDGK